MEPGERNFFGFWRNFFGEEALEGENDNDSESGAAFEGDIV